MRADGRTMTPAEAHTEFLFSYGTLQLETVQMSTSTGSCSRRPPKPWVNRPYSAKLLSSAGGKESCIGANHVFRHEKRRGVPGLPGHSPGCERFSVQPFRERPIAQRADTRQLYQLRSGLFGSSGCHECRHPEPAHHRPDASVVI